MVVPLGPGKFYGSSLPRPRIYNDVKLNANRVHPPVPVTDALLSWAEEAHWSMGGLSFKRLRLQGRIEGNVNRLRKFREKQVKTQNKVSLKHPKAPIPNAVYAKEGRTRKRVGSVSPPMAPKVTKRRRFMDLFDSDNEEEDQVEEEEEVPGEKLNKKRPARKLVGEFDRVAKEIEADKIKSGRVGEVEGLRTRRRAMDEEVIKVVGELNREVCEGKKLKKGISENGGEHGGSSSVSGVRVSARLTKLRSD